MARWLEFLMTVDREGVEAVSELFGRLGDGGVAIQEPIHIIDDEPGYSLRHDHPVEVRTYVIDDDRGPARRQKIEEAVWHLSQIWPLGKLTVGIVDDADWANEWKKHFQIFRVGHRIVIQPDWLSYDPKPDDIVVKLDPGLAFGTGLHPTTRACLRSVEDRVAVGMQVLDVGTGSGILAIAALGGGAAGVVALDVDPIATKAAAGNLARNGLADRATIATGSLPSELAPAGSFDAVMANIIASVIIDLASDLRAVLRPGGILIAGGIIEARAAETLARLLESGFSLLESAQDGDWRSYCLAATTGLPPNRQWESEPRA